MATQERQVYKCEICGIVAEVLDGGAGELVCCGQPMTLLRANLAPAQRPKHLPVIEETAGGVRVRIGAMAHPMEEKHFIEWIEVAAGNRVCRQQLGPSRPPEANFEVQGDNLVVRAVCNLHGLWTTP